MSVIAKKIRDTTWVRQTFLIPTKDGKTLLDQVDRRNAAFTSARFKFSNTALGGTLAINPPPQYTPNADRRVPGLNMRRNKNFEPLETNTTGTLGRYYSEVVDDNSRIVSMRFGVPQFNSLSTFFTGFYNYNAGVLARTGRATGLFYAIGRAAGFVVSLVVWPLLIINLGADILNFFLNRPRSKYYYIKPTMPLYWNAVTALVNQIAVNKGIVPRMLDKDTKNYLDNRWPFTENDLAYAAKFGDVIMEGGQINVYAMSTRYQRLARSMYAYMLKTFNDNEEYSDMHSVMQYLYDNGVDFSEVANRNPSYLEYLGKWLKSAVGSVKTPSESSANTSATSGASGGSGSTAGGSNTDASGASTSTNVSTDTESAPTKESDVAGFFTYLNAELDDGSNFVSFRVDNESSVQESFSSQTGESEIAMKINSVSGQSRETTFNLAGGNITDGMLGDILGAGIMAAKDFVGGVADQLSISGIAALGGAAFVDIPKHWTGSTANLPRMNYSFSLVSPYGNKLSQLMFMYVPLCMILAAALPLSTGKQSYTSPFLVEAYDRGRAQTRLGIIDSLSITRGTTHLGFNNSGNAMGIDVSFSIQDLSTVMHMPIIQGFQPGNGLFDDDTAFTDYMAILGSLTLNEQTYPVEKLRLRLTRTMSNLNTWFSTAHFAQWVGDLAPAQLLGAFYAGRVNR